MKTNRMLLSIFALFAAVASSPGQGTIGFGNSPASLVTTNDNDGIHSGPAGLSAGSGIYVQLFYQPDTGGRGPGPIDTLALIGGNTGNWEAVGSPVSIGPTIGRFGIVTVTTGNDVAPGGNVWLVAVGWNGGYTTLAGFEAQTPPGNSYLVNASAVWSQGTGVLPTSPVLTANNFPGLVLATVPEPSTWALAGMGAAIFLSARRNQAGREIIRDCKPR